MSNNKIMRFVVSAVAIVALMALTAFATDITGGFGAIGGVDDTYYAAPATLNAAGDGLDLGEAIQLTDAKNTGLAGLYAVSTDETVTIDDEIVYVYGSIADRKTITERGEYGAYAKGGFLTVTASTVDKNADSLHDTYGNTLVSDGTNTYVVAVDEDGDGVDDNYVGTYALSSRYTFGKSTIGDKEYNLLYKNPINQVSIKESTTSFVKGSFSGVGGWSNYYGGAHANIPYMAMATGNHFDTTTRNAYYDAMQSYAAATDETEKAEHLATMKTKLQEIIDMTENYNLKYALPEKEIVKIEEINFYKYAILNQGNYYSNSNHVVKFDAHVADEKGNVKTYSYLHNAVTLNSSEATLTVDFDEVTNGRWLEKPTKGYLVGFTIWPYYGINNTEDFKITAKNENASSIRLYHKAASNSSYYSIDTPTAKKPTSLKIDEEGKLTGTIPGMTYEYAKLSSADMLNGTALTYTTVDDTTALTDAGLYAVRIVSAQGEYAASESAIIYVSGTIDDKKAIIERTVWMVSGSKTVAADKVAYDENNNPIHPTYGNPLKLIGGKYYVVAVDENPADGWDDNFPQSKIAYDSTNDYYYVRDYTELRVAAKNSTDFADGVVTAPGTTTNFWSGNFRDWSVGVTSGRNISGNALSAFKTAQDADPYDDNTKKEAFEAIANAASVKDYCYSYAVPSEKVSTIEELGSYTYKLYFYENVKYENLEVKFEAFVMDDNGKVTTYTYIHKPTTVTTASVALGLNPAAFTVDFGKEVNGEWKNGKPTSGYLIGFRIWPFYGFKDHNKFTASTTAQTNLMLYPGENGAVIKTAPDTPDVTVNAGSNTLTVNNFASGTTYAYSYDEGETWTQFITKTIDLPKLANTYYWVKACADATHYESEIAKPETPSACLVFKGASLVLDGKIGIRFYFDFDASASGNMTQIKFDIYNGETKIDDRDFLFKVSHQSWERASFKDDERTAYITFYTPPKDYDDMVIDTDYALTYDIDGNKTYVSDTIGDGHTITRYFEVFDDLVKAGDEECIAANDFVTALEAYCKNADVFFDNNAQALDSVVADENAIEATANPEKSGKITYGTDTILEHYSTSLILEDEITIRHYFKWNKIEGSSLEGLTAKLDGEVDIDVDTESCVKASTTGEEGVNYLYIDIENVNVDNLNRLYTLDLTLGEETISVKYAVANYIKSTYNSGDTKLANLVKAIYNCYEKWVDYPFKEERDKTLSEQRQEIKEAMTLAVNTKTVWKEVPEFNPTIDKYSHIKAITYDGLEYKGGKTKIFAYVGFPEGASEESPVPAVVLVHGGGGHPYMEWVRLWNERGYAAIAMETTGYFPLVANAGTIGGTTDNANFSYGLTEDFAEEGYVSAPGPDRLYPTEYMEVSEQWAYHGISQVILAGNILRQDKRVDVDNIGISGISWGGVTTTQVIGYDNRFSFAIPIYGMAYLGDEMRSFTNFNDPYVNALWASERNLDNAKMPIFWFAYNDDNNFGVNQYVKSYNHTESFNDKNTLTMLGGWGHSHVSGWAKNQSYYFADWVTYGEKGFITFDSQPEGREVDFKVTIPDNVKGDVTARVYYITEPMSYSRHDKFENGLNYVYLDQFWQTADEGIEVDVETGRVTGTVPEEAMGYYINLSFAIEEGSDEIMEVSSVYVALE